MMFPINGEGRPGKDGHSQCSPNNAPQSYGNVVPSASSRDDRRGHLRRFAVAVILAEAAYELDAHGGDVDAALTEARNRIASDFAAAQTAADEALRLVAEVESS